MQLKPLTHIRMVKLKKNNMILSSMGENVGQLECSYIADRIAKWHSQFGKFKTVYYVTYHMI